MNATPLIHPRGSPVKREVLAVFLLLALVCLLAWPGMHAPLLLDDLDQLDLATGFSSWQDCFGKDACGLFRPVKNLIYYGLGDISVFRWHALNLAIYLAAIPVVYLFLRRLLESPVWAFAAVTLWATCPTQASTAIWMSCVNISLAIAFTCACVYFHDVSRSQSTHALRLTILAGLCLLLAQTNYETAVAVPALCVLVDALRKRPLFSREALVRYAMLATVTLVYLLLRTLSGAKYTLQGTGFVPDSPAWQVSVSAPWFLWRHFSMWLMPAGRIELLGTYIWGISATPWELAAAWVWLLGLIGLIFLTWKRHPWVAFGLLWFLITSFPSSNFVPLKVGPITDYYLVFPGIGLAIALVGCAKAIIAWITAARTDPRPQRKLLGGSLLGVVALWRLLCIPLFWLQAGLWSRPLEFFLRCDLTRPGQYQLQAMAARELLIGGQLQQAKELALKSHATAPWHGTNSMILGRVAFDTADYDEAEQRFRDAIDNTSGKSLVQDYSRLHLAKSFMAQEAKRPLIRETLLPLLNNPRSSCHMAAIYLQVDSYLAQNKPNDARRAATKAVQIHPADPQLADLLKTIEDKFPASTVVPQPQR